VSGNDRFSVPLKLTVAALKLLAEMPELEHLELVGCQVEPEGLAAFDLSPKLRTVDLSYATIKPEALESFAAAHPLWNYEHSASPSNGANGAYLVRKCQNSETAETP